METKRRPVDIRQLKAEGDSEGIFEGLTAKFGVVDRDNDRIARGAFQRTLRENGHVRPLQVSHDPTLTANAGVAELSTSTKGLRVRGRVNLDTQLGRETWSQIQHGKKHGLDVGLSIGFEAVEKRWEGDVRVLEDIEVFEDSITLFPAQPTGVEEIVGTKSLTPSERKIYTRIAKELTRQLRHH